MMFSSNYGDPFNPKQPVYQPAQHQLINNNLDQFGTSMDSNVGSVTGTSLLTAANTIVFGDQASSLNESEIGSPSTSSSSLIHTGPTSLTRAVESSSFTDNLKRIQQQQLKKKQDNDNQTALKNSGDLDFDLHYEDEDRAVNQLERLHLESKDPLEQMIFNQDTDDIQIIENENDGSTLNKRLASKKPMSIANLGNTLQHQQAFPTRMSYPATRHEKSLHHQNENYDIAGSPRKRGSSHLTGVNNSKGPSSFLSDAKPIKSPTPHNIITSNFSVSRASVKMQLMKQQAEQVERKLAGNTSNSMSSVPQNFMETSSTSTVCNDSNYTSQMLDSTSTLRRNSLTDTITMPIDIQKRGTAMEIIPRRLLPEQYQTEIKLENPTRYHVMQIAKHLQQSVAEHASSLTAKPIEINNNIANYSVNYMCSNRNNSLTHRIDTQPMTPSDDIAIIPQSSFEAADFQLERRPQMQPASIESRNSNWDPAQFSPTNSSFSQSNELLDENDDFLPDEIQSFRKRGTLNPIEMQKEINLIENFLNLPKTMPTDGCFDSFSTKAHTSSSCPNDSALSKRIANEGKDRHRKEAHNMIEKKRRYNINDKIKELGTILPKFSQTEPKKNKGSILKMSVDYILSLQTEVQNQNELDDKLRQMITLNKKLVDRIKELEQNTSVSTNASSDTEMFNLDAQPSLNGQISKQHLMDSKIYPSQADYYSMSQPEQERRMLDQMNFDTDTDLILQNNSILDDLLNRADDDDDPILGSVNDIGESLIDAFK